MLTDELDRPLLCQDEDVPYDDGYDDEDDDEYDDDDDWDEDEDDNDKWD